MTTHQDNIKLDRTAAYWYACGYNDHRQPETDRPQPWVDPMEFVEYWLFCTSDDKSRPSMQDAFKVFLVKS